MSRRDADVCFAHDEKLFRRVNDRDLKQGAVRPESLRLQISVVRSAHGREEDAAEKPPGKRNGVATVQVSEVRECCDPKIQAICVDEPLSEAPGHALIALHSMESPGGVTPADINVLRAKIAAKMKVTTKPT